MIPAISKYLIQYSFHLFTGNRLWVYKDVFEKTQWHSFREIEEFQWARCKEMIKYAYENIRFYKEQWDRVRIHPSDIEMPKDFRNIPILSKEMVTEHFKDLRHPSTWIVGFPRKTSGSSGFPLMIEKDGESVCVIDAIMYRNYNWYGVGIGEKQAKFWGVPLDRMAREKMKIKDALLNRIRFSSFDVSVPRFQEFLARMHAFRPGYIHGYAQTIFKFAQYVEDFGIDLSPLKLKVVIVTGEMIFDGQAALIEKAFRCRVANEYGSTEVGTIAMSCPEGGLHLMAENLFIEFENNGIPASEGEEGEIIITELFGRLMPLIRYRIGDYGIRESGMCACGRGLPLMKKLKGRIFDFIVCPDGKLVDPYFIDYILRDIGSRYGKITQYRMVQEENHELNVELCYAGNGIENVKNTLECKMKDILGDGLKIRFRFTDHIAVEDSGKHRVFVSRVRESDTKRIFRN